MATYAVDIRRLTPFLGNVPLKAITPGMIQSTYALMLKGGSPNAAWSRCTPFSIGP
jgi:hypothetical protein